MKELLDSVSKKLIGLECFSENVKNEAFVVLKIKCLALGKITIFKTRVTKLMVFSGKHKIS